MRASSVCLVLPEPFFLFKKKRIKTRYTGESSRFCSIWKKVIFMRNKDYLTVLMSGIENARALQP